MAGIDLNRTTSGVLLPPEVSAEIWASAVEQSAVMQLSRQINLPGAGISIPIITGDAEADWVNETDEISVSRATLGNKTITPYKLAVTEPFSNEFKRDLPALYAELARRLPGSIGRKFDATVFGATSAPGSNFDLLDGASAVAIKPHATDVKKNTYAGLVAADQAVATGGGLLNGWAISPQARGILLGQVDSLGRPLIVNNIQTDGAVASLLGSTTFATKAVYKAGSPNVVGFAGDWSSAVYGTVAGISISVSDQASLADGVTTYTVGAETVDIPKQINLWQRDMFALRVTVDIGFRVRDLAHFVKLTDGTIA